MKQKRPSESQIWTFEADTSHGDVAIAALEMLAAFERTQDAMRWILARWIHKENLVDFMPTSVHSTADKDLAGYFLEMATRVEANADLAQFKAVHHRVKTSRDVIAHGMYLQYSRNESGASVIGYPHFRGDKKVADQDGQRAHFSARVLGKRKAEALWLLHQVEFVRQQTEIGLGPSGISDRVEKPSSSPGQIGR